MKPMKIMIGIFVGWVIIDQYLDRKNINTIREWSNE